MTRAFRRIKKIYDVLLEITNRINVLYCVIVINDQLLTLFTFIGISFYMDSFEIYRLTYISMQHSLNCKIDYHGYKSCDKSYYISICNS